MESANLRRLLINSIAGSVLLGLSGLLLFSDGLPFMDLPNHVARACVISEMFNGTGRWTDFFHMEPLFIPYVAADALLAGLCAIMSPFSAGSTYMALSFLAVCGSVVFFANSVYPRIRLGASGFLFLTFVATNWYFLSGFVAFELSIAAVFLSLGFLERTIRSTARQITTNYVILTLMIVLTYLTHLAGFLVLIILGTVRVLRALYFRERSFSQLLGCSLPALVVFMQHVGSALFKADTVKENTLIYRTPLNKLLSIGTMFVRSSYVWDTVIFLTFIFAIFYGICSVRRHITVRRAVRVGFLSEIAILTLLFVVLPVGVGIVYDIDGRPLPFLAIFLLLALFSTRTIERKTTIVLTSTFVATLNFGLLAPAIARQNYHAKDVIDALRLLPHESRVLSVSTVPDEGRLSGLFHTPTLQTLLRGSPSTYLFKAEDGHPMKYFHMLRSCYTPSQFWYLRNDTSVDWNKVAEHYDYLFIEKPFDPSRFPMERLEKVGEGRGGELFRVY